jgi:DNA-binding CsgD family transcriptional regulator
MSTEIATLPAIQITVKEQSIVRLTPREVEVVSLVALGLSHKEIAERLGIMPSTVESHRTNVNFKLGLTYEGNSGSGNAVLITRWAIEHGIVEIGLAVAREKVAQEIEALSLLDEGEGFRPMTARDRRVAKAIAHRVRGRQPAS